jgi:N-acetylglucosaminyl-diphospho-decaprenol L-rhamnosyltransferase
MAPLCGAREAERAVTDIAVAIVNFNTRGYLQACLATVQAESPREIVVVDHASTDRSAEMVRAEFPQVVLLAKSTNPGYGVGANEAIASCTCPYVLLLNSDTLLPPGTLRALSTYLDRHPQAALVGPRLVNPDGTLRPSCYAFPGPVNMLLESTGFFRLLARVPVLRNCHLRSWPHDRSRVVPWVMGAALAIRRQAFEAVAGFDESFFMYNEEVDLCYRLRRSGWQVHFTPVVTVVHDEGASTRQEREHMHAEWYISSMRFYRQHYSRLRCTLLFAMMKGAVLARWARDMAHLRAIRQAGKHTRLVEDAAHWRRLFLDSW